MGPGATVRALPERQAIVSLQVEEGSTIKQVVERSGLQREFPEIGIRPLSCAVFGRIVEITQAVATGDRIEILRPLLIDPKESRRQAAARAKRER